MDYLHWVGETVLLLYGIRLVDLRIFVALMITWVPATLLIMHMLSGWIAAVVAFAALVVAARVVRVLLRRRERERVEHAPSGCATAQELAKTIGLSDR